MHAATVALRRAPATTSELPTLHSAERPRSDLCFICRSLISSANVLIKLPVGVNSAEPPTSGFAGSSDSGGV